MRVRTRPARSPAVPPKEDQPTDKTLALSAER
jgi:hypothetical protein